MLEWPCGISRQGLEICVFFFLLTVVTGQASEPPQFGHDAGKSLKAYELCQLWLLGSETDVLLIIYIAWPSRDLC